MSSFAIFSLAIWLSIHISTTVVGGCKFGSGNDCVFQCHCASGTCDQDKGTCSSGCQNDDGSDFVEGYQTFSGPTCQIGNIAKGKTAWQTGAFGGLEADRALDGRAYEGDPGTSQAAQQYCAHPEASGEGAYWAIDFGKIHRIFNVTIFNTKDTSGWFRLRNLKFLVSDTNISSNFKECGSYIGQPADEFDEKHTIECNAVGRYLKIQKEGSIERHLMTLCEIIIFGYQFNVEEDCTGDACHEVNNRRCKQWWGPEEKCYQHIRRGGIERSLTDLTVTVLSHQKMRVSFVQDDRSSPGLESYYEYDVEYKNSTDSQYRHIRTITHMSDYTRIDVDVDNLDPHTYYSFKLSLYREQYERRDKIGDVTTDVSFRTFCADPEQPQDVQVTPDVGQIKVSLSLGDSNCDRYTSLTIFVDGIEAMSYNELNGGREYIVSAEPGNHGVYIMVINNAENSTTTTTYRVTVPGQITTTTPSTTTTTTTTPSTTTGIPGSRGIPGGSTGNANGGEKGGNDDVDAGMIAGIVVAFVVITVAVIVVIFFVLRSRKKKKVPTATLR